MVDGTSPSAHSGSLLFAIPGFTHGWGSSHRPMDDGYGFGRLSESSDRYSAPLSCARSLTAAYPSTSGWGKPQRCRTVDLTSSPPFLSRRSGRGEWPKTRGEKRSGFPCVEPVELVGNSKSCLANSQAGPSTQPDSLWDNGISKPFSGYFFLSLRTIRYCCIKPATQDPPPMF